jgi:hypothetical protein
MEPTPTPSWQVGECRRPLTVDEIFGEKETLSQKGSPFGFDGDVVHWVSPAAPGYRNPLLRDPALGARDFEHLLVDVRRRCNR